MTTEDTPTEDPIERWRRETMARLEASKPSRRTRLANWIEDQAEWVIVILFLGIGVFAVVFAARFAWELGSAVVP